MRADVDALLPLHVELTPEHELFRSRLRAWLDRHPPPDESSARDRLEVFEIRRAWQRTLADHGFIGVSWPREHGGLAAGPMAQFLYYEELAVAGAPELPNRPGLVLIGPTLIAHANDEAKRSFLPGILDASDIWAQCFSEPDAGSDLAAIRTTAALDGGSLRIDGQKTWVTMGDLADHAVVMCRTGAPAARHRTLSMVIVDLHQPGVEVRPIRQATGESEFSEIFFDGATASVDTVIGGLDGGWAAAMTLLEFERVDRLFTDHSAPLHRIEAARRVLLAAERRDTGGDRLDELWRRFADVRARAHVLREMNLDVVRRRECGETIGASSSPVKVFWAELTQDVTGLCLDLADMSDGLEQPAVTAYLSGRMATVYSGTIDIQRSIIAERVLGLPRPASLRPRKETSS